MYNYISFVKDATLNDTPFKRLKALLNVNAYLLMYEKFSHNCWMKRNVIKISCIRVGWIKTIDI